MKFFESSSFNLDYLDSKINSLLLPNTCPTCMNTILCPGIMKFEVLVIELRASHALFT